MRSFMLFTWHCVASIAATLLIAAGLVRRAKRKAFDEGVISAIYFHKPKRRLFLRCIRWLIKNGYTFISADDVLEILKHGKPVPRGAVWLSFDDGWRELLTNVLPIARENHIPVTLFIPPGIIEGDGHFPWLHDPEHPSFSGGPGGMSQSSEGSREAITLAELKEIAEWPQVTIESHTDRHPITLYCTKDRIRHEIWESKRKLEAWTGRPVKCFAYPEGKYDGREKEFLIESGHECAVTTRSGFIRTELDHYKLPRFSVGDDMPFSEAICSMVGVWRPVVDWIKELCGTVLDVPRSCEDHGHPVQNGVTLGAIQRCPSPSMPAVDSCNGALPPQERRPSHQQRETS